MMLPCLSVIVSSHEVQKLFWRLSKGPCWPQWHCQLLFNVCIFITISCLWNPPLLPGSFFCSSLFFLRCLSILLWFWPGPPESFCLSLSLPGVSNSCGEVGLIPWHSINSRLSLSHSTEDTLNPSTPDSSNMRFAQRSLENTVSGANVVIYYSALCHTQDRSVGKYPAHKIFTVLALWFSIAILFSLSFPLSWLYLLCIHFPSETPNSFYTSGFPPPPFPSALLKWSAINKCWHVKCLR